MLLSVLVSFRTCQTLYLSHFDEKKVFQHWVLAQELLLLLESGPCPARENSPAFAAREFQKE